MAELAGTWTYRSFNPAYVTRTQAPQEELADLIFADGLVFDFQTPTGTTLEGKFGLPDGGVLLDLTGTVKEGENVSFEFETGPTARGSYETRTGTETPVSFDIVGTGRKDAGTDGWEYRYHGHLTRHWPGWPQYESDRHAALVGSVFRAKPHNGVPIRSPAGYVASFIAVKPGTDTWDWRRELSGLWTYRSFHNKATPVYQIPPSAHGRLILQEAVFKLETPTSTTLQGAIEWASGVLDLKGTVRPGTSFEIVGTGRRDTNTWDWKYRYHGHLIPDWPKPPDVNVVDQRPALVGSALRERSHGDVGWISPNGSVRGGYVAPFIAVKRD